MATLCIILELELNMTEAWWLVFLFLPPSTWLVNDKLSTSAFTRNHQKTFLHSLQWILSITARYKWIFSFTTQLRWWCSAWLGFLGGFFHFKWKCWLVKLRKLTFEISDYMIRKIEKFSKSLIGLYFSRRAFKDTMFLTSLDFCYTPN